MKKNYKNLLSIALVLLLVAVTSLTFAYWDQLTADKDGEITLGVGKTITIENNQLPEGNLVPHGSVTVNGDVNEIVVKYNVTASHYLSENTFTVEVTTNDPLLEAEVDTYGQFESGDLAKEITIRFTLTAPTDKAAYDALQEKELTYTVTFKYLK